MAAHVPEDLDVLFAHAINAGDLDALVALYESDATLTAQPGRTVMGHAAIRETLAGLLAGKPHMEIAVRSLARTGDLALLSARWSLALTQEDGQRAQMTGESVEVARRQPDGTWRFAIDEPHGLSTAP